MSKSSNKMSVSAAAELIGFQRQTVTSWMNKAGLDPKDGCDLNKVLKWKFNWEREQGREEATKKYASLLESEEEGIITKDEAVRRRAVAEAILKEIDLKERLGEVVPIDDVVARVEQQYSAVREKLFGIPMSVAEDLVAQEDSQVIVTIIRKAIDDVLEELDAEATRKRSR